MRCCETCEVEFVRCKPAASRRGRHAGALLLVRGRQISLQNAAISSAATQCTLRGPLDDGCRSAGALLQRALGSRNPCAYGDLSKHFQQFGAALAWVV